MAKQSTIYKSPEGVDLIRQKSESASCEGCFYWDGNNCTHPKRGKNFSGGSTGITLKGMMPHIPFIKCITITPVTRHYIYHHYVKAF